MYDIDRDGHPEFFGYMGNSVDIWQISDPDNLPSPYVAVPAAENEIAATPTGRRYFGDLNGDNSEELIVIVNPGGEDGTSKVFHNHGP